MSRIISSKFVCYALNNLCANYIYDECSYVGSVLWGYYYKEQLLREWFTPSIGVFEGHEFSIPSGYDNILRSYYGDYMELPAEEKRITHFYNAAWKN